MCFRRAIGCSCCRQVAWRGKQLRVVPLHHRRAFSRTELDACSDLLSASPRSLASSVTQGDIPEACFSPGRDGFSIAGAGDHGHPSSKYSLAGSTGRRQRLRCSRPATERRWARRYRRHCATHEYKCEITDRHLHLHVLPERPHCGHCQGFGG